MELTYLNRPIFNFDIDWANAVNRAITYDLRETALGFGPEYFVPTQTYTAQGWEFTVMANTDALIASLDAFTASLYGRLAGFWLPVPFEAMTIVNAVDHAQFDVKACNLTATWQDRPDITLWFTNADGSGGQALPIAAVADNGNGTERVTIQPLNIVPAGAAYPPFAFPLGIQPLYLVQGLVIGLTYKWTPGANEVQLSNGAQIFNAAATFVATAVTATIQGNAFNVPVTGTIGLELNPAAAPGMFVRRLHYVRLADDAEKSRFEAESWQTRSFNVIELPLEYTNIETGRQPIYLYHFSAASPVLQNWYYTSFAAKVWSGGKQYQPFPITHGAVNQTARGDKDELDIEAKADPSHPFSLFLPSPFGAQMNVQVFACLLATPDNATLIFNGIVRLVDDQGTKYVGHCASLLYLLDRKLPRMLVQPNCSYNLYEPSCGIRRAAYETQATITAINNDPNSPNVVVQMKFPTQNPTRHKTANWFAGGPFEVGFGVSYEPRTILASSWDNVHALLTLQLNLPLWKAQVGNVVIIAAGCDGLASTCANKFNNFNRFGGFPAVPQRNLTLEAFNNQPVSQGGKK
jgi:hypothetical protein